MRLNIIFAFKFDEFCMQSLYIGLQQYGNRRGTIDAITLITQDNATVDVLKNHEY